MIISPTIVNHPKFVALKSAIGDYAMEALVRIWAHCQEDQRAEFWAEKSPEYLEIIARWSGERLELWTALLRTGWVIEENGGIRVHEWNNYNSTLLRSWNAVRNHRKKKPDDLKTIARPSSDDLATILPSSLSSLNEKIEKSVQKEEERSTGIEVPSDAEVFGFIQDWPGEPASATPTIPKDWAIQWLARMAGRREWPADWRRKLTADWRAGFRDWLQGKKNGPADKPKKRALWEISKDISAVEKLMDEHPSNCWPANKPRDPAIEQEYDALKARLAALKKETANV